ncbi:MAG: hypothetical protein IJX36_01135, partial [Thermoguttaceae bacterium]|nr:hypothetical protein [Thermoguttaceae bacterium]
SAAFALRSKSAAVSALSVVAFRPILTFGALVFSSTFFIVRFLPLPFNSNEYNQFQSKRKYRTTFIPFKYAYFSDEIYVSFFTQNLHYKNRLYCVKSRREIF